MDNLFFGTPAPPPQVEAYRPPSFIKCRYCDEPIFLGDRAVYFHHGIIGRGAKSGAPHVTDGEHTSGESVVHELCVASFLLTEIIDSSEETEAVVDSITEDLFGQSYSDLATQEPLCSVCEARIEDD